MIIIYQHGDPVRIRGKRGLFRFVEYAYPDASAFDCLECGPADYGELYGATAEVIDPRRELSRTVAVEDLVYPGASASPRDVASHPGVRELSERAHSRSKGK